MFPGGRPPSIVSAKKLNYCVRNGNRCDLLAITTEEAFCFTKKLRFFSVLRFDKEKNKNLLTIF